jgi:hypothetical protein
MMDEVIGGMDSYQAMIGQVLSNERVRNGFTAVLLDVVYAALKERGRPPEES